MASLLNMSKLEVLEDPAYSLANNDSLRIAIQNKSIQVLGRPDPCPLIGSVVPQPQFKPVVTTSKTVTIATTEVGIRSLN